MSSATHLKIKDYVRYTGNDNVEAGPLKNPAIAQIVNFEHAGVALRYQLKLLSSNENIITDAHHLTDLVTDEYVLLRFGFRKEKMQYGDRFVFQDLIVSRTSFSVPVEPYTIHTGYCLADFSANIGWHYAPADILSLSTGDVIRRFFNDFRSVNNINDLFAAFESYSMEENIGLLF